MKKNKKFIDPRYFMDEKMESTLKEGSMSAVIAQDVTLEKAEQIIDMHLSGDEGLKAAFANATDESGIVNSTALATNTDPSIVNHAIDIYNAIMKGTIK